VTVPQYLQRVGVVPIVEDAFKNVGVPARGHGLKEVATNNLAAIGDASAIEDLGGAADDMREIGEPSA
jgi:hypothetical protein